MVRSLIDLVDHWVVGVLLVLALALGIVLVTYRRRGTMPALSAAVLFFIAGCRSNEGGTGVADRTNDQPAPQSGAESAGDAALPVATGKGEPAPAPASFPIDELKQDPTWRAFCALWKKVGELPSGSDPFFGPPSPAKDDRNPEEVDFKGLAKEAEEQSANLLALAGTGLIPKEYAKLLGDVLSSRVRTMQGSCFGLMLMHAPLRSAVDECNMTSRFEERVDVLVELRKKGQIDSDVYSQAIAGVADQIKRRYLVQALGLFAGRALQPASTARAQLDDIKRRCTEPLVNQARSRGWPGGADSRPMGCETVLREYERLGAQLPEFDLLAQELEQ